jgi:hypothetical protein
MPMLCWLARRRYDRAHGTRWGTNCSKYTPSMAKNVKEWPDDMLHDATAVNVHFERCTSSVSGATCGSPDTVHQHHIHMRPKNSSMYN